MDGFCYLHGHMLYWNSDEKAYRFAKDDSLYIRFDDNDEVVEKTEVELECPKCEMKIEDDADPCLGYLPGVRNACCGHGVHEGYIEFENGVRIVGNFEVESFP